MKSLFAVLLLALSQVTARVYEKTALGESIDQATVKVLKEAYRESEDKNVITSPLGVILLLSQYSAGAGPGGKKEIYKFLGGDEKQLTESFSDLSNKYTQIDPSYLTLANKIYVSDKYQLDEAFADVASAYGNEVDTVDFFDNEKVANIINTWAAEKTQGRITSPVSASDIGVDVPVALFNVIFFEGEWAVPFDRSQTEDADFYIDENTIEKKPTMSVLDSIPFAFSKELEANLIELRYKQDGFRMVIVLPHKKDGLSSVLKKAEKRGLLEAMSKLEEEKIRLSLPKFEIKTKLDFKDILNEVGIKKIFDEDATGIVKGDTVNVKKIFQEAYVKVDEKGSVASAVTEMIPMTKKMLTMTRMGPLEIKVDHPFLFYILHEDKVLFAGTYTH